MNTEIDALFMTPFVREWLRNSTAVQVLHVFDRACNLVNEHGAVVSLVVPELGRGPFALVAPVERPFSAHITPETPVMLDGDTLRLGALTVSTTTTPLWHPRPDWEGLRTNTAVWRRHLPPIQEVIADEQAKIIAGMTAVTQARFKSATGTLLNGIKTRELGAVRDGAYALAGLGPGLTPAGDDFLMGVLYGLWASTTDRDVGRLAQVVAETAVPRTTTLSAAWLQAAARGEANEAWHDFVGQLCMSGGGWQTAVDKIRTIGHSSGIVALMGFADIVI